MGKNGLGRKRERGSFWKGQKRESRKNEVRNRGKGKQRKELESLEEFESLWKDLWSVRLSFRWKIVLENRTSNESNLRIVSIRNTILDYLWIKEWKERIKEKEERKIHRFAKKLRHFFKSCLSLWVLSSSLVRFIPFFFLFIFFLPTLFTFKPFQYSNLCPSFLLISSSTSSFPYTFQFSAQKSLQYISYIKCMLFIFPPSSFEQILYPFYFLSLSHTSWAMEMKMIPTFCKTFMYQSESFHSSCFSTFLLPCMNTVSSSSFSSLLKHAFKSSTKRKESKTLYSFHRSPFLMNANNWR